jgi:hypothetical protein
MFCNSPVKKGNSIQLSLNFNLLIKFYKFSDYVGFTVELHAFQRQNNNFLVIFQAHRRSMPKEPSAYTNVRILKKTSAKCNAKMLATLAGIKWRALQQKSGQN